LLFVPAFILVSLLVWFFNDKIKARWRSYSQL
jgi:hypothetical protein